MIALRVSEDADIAAITAIYAHHVRHGTGSFETEPPDEAEMAARRRGILEKSLPYLVATENNTVVGYAYAGPYRPRHAYRFAVEDSIYVHPAYTGRGIGALLLPALIEACAARGMRQLIACIGDSGNAASIRLHRRFGFTESGVVRDCGFKFGRWLDVVFMQLALGAGASSDPE